ncbi:MAG TPA: LEPR-XLL domain-containing protein, partial [Phycisphaerae bacterium]|nr:LEPR-XLL domain-containing protein [Phycisphaerae bacterium]
MRRSRESRKLMEGLESRVLLSANLLGAFGFGTTSPYGQAITGMAVDASGDIVVTGNFQGTVDVDPSVTTQNISSQGSFNYDSFLAKYHSDGTLVWVKTLSSPGNDLASGL